MASKIPRNAQLIERVRSGLADVIASRERLEAAVGNLTVSAAGLREQARTARLAGRPDLVLECQKRIRAADALRFQIVTQAHDLQIEEEKLRVAVQRLQGQAAATKSRSAQPAKRKQDYYVVNARNSRGDVTSRATHIMLSRSPNTPGVGSALFWDGILGWGAGTKSTLCGLWAGRHVNIFSPAEVTCRECRRRWEIATGQR